MAFTQVNFMSKCLMRVVTFNAIIPADKLQFPGMPAKEKKPFKTLYLLHGIFGNYTDWVNGTRIQAWAEEKNVAVIMPSGDNHFYLDDEARGNNYGEFIGKELVEFTRDLFPLSRERGDTYIAGLSMGGYGAIRNGLKYADTFSHIAGLSSALITETMLSSTDDAPTLIGKRSYYESIFGDLSKVSGSDKDPKALTANLLKSGAQLPAIYLCCGTEDFLISQNRDFHNFLTDNNVVHTYEEGSGAHTWEFWDTHIHKVLEWLPLS